MSDLFQKIKIWAKKAGLSRDSYEREGIRPGRHWKILLTVTLVLLCVVADLAFYFYLKIADGTFFSVEPTSTQTVTSLNQKLLQTTVDGIKLRKETSDAASKSLPVTDPS